MLTVNRFWNRRALYADPRRGREQSLPPPHTVVSFASTYVRFPGRTLSIQFMRKGKQDARQTMSSLRVLRYVRAGDAGCLIKRGNAKAHGMLALPEIGITLERNLKKLAPFIVS